MRKGERQICWGLDRLAKKEVARSKRLTQELALGDFSFTTKAVKREAPSPCYSSAKCNVRCLRMDIDMRGTDVFASTRRRMLPLG